VSNNITITAPAAITFNAPTTVNPSCAGVTDGEIHITATGGTGVITYTISPGGTSNTTGDFTALAGGTYTVSANDAGGCPAVVSSNITLTAPAAITFNAPTTVNATCADGNDAEIHITATGGTGTITYTLSPGGTANTTGDFIGLTAGTYTVSADDAGGCPAVVSSNIVITEPAAIAVTSVAITNVTCNGDNDGQIQISAGGGTGSLTYTITPGGTSNGTGLFTALTAGNYSINISDVPGCSIDTTITVTEPVAIVATISGTTSICDGDQATLTVTFTGGSSPWNFQYSDGTTTSPVIPSFFNSITFAVSPTTTTTYTLVSAADNTCTGTVAGSAIVTVNDPADPSLAVDAAISPLCNGGTTDITVDNSQLGVSYQLRNDADDSAIGAPVLGNGGTIALSTGSLAVTTTFNVLATAGGCPSVELTDKATVTVSGSINANLTVNPLVTPLCSGGSTSIRVVSSQTGVMYQLRNNADDSAIGTAVAGTGADIDLPTGVLTSQTIFNILANNGTCSIELTDIDTVDVDVNPNPGLTVSVVLDPLCVGGNTDIQIDNSETGVSYQLRNDADDSNIGAPVVGTGGTILLNTGALAATTTFNILASGSGACAAVELTTTPTVNVSGTIDITLNITPQSDPICEGTSTVITITNSEVGVNYQLRNDADDSNIGAAVAGTGSDLDIPTGNLAATTVFNVLANNGSCSIQMTNTPTVNVGVNPVTSLTVDATIDPLCTGGTSGIRIQNSQNGVSYQLRNDADDSAIGAPVAGDGGTIILSTGALTATTTFNVLASNGGICPDVELATVVTVTVGGTINSALTTTASPATPICAGNGAFVVVQASEGGVNYQLRNDADDSAIGAVVAGNGGDINLPTGNLAATTTFNVLASNGTCSIELTDTETITVNAAPSTAPTVTANPAVICPNNTSSIRITASEIGVSYQLRNDADDTNVGSAVAGNGGLISLPTGTLTTTTTFNVLATVGTCSVELGPVSVNVLLPGDPACTGGTGNCATVVITPIPKPATCTNSDGKITFIITPFVPAVNITGVKIDIQGISNTNLTIARTQFNDSVFTALPMGVYDYTITYGDVSCIKTGQVTIDQSGTVGTPVASNVINPVCAGSASGAVTINVAGETGNVLEWSYDGGITDPFKPFVVGSQITGIPAGPAPTFDRVISIRRDASDPCFASVTITMQDQNAPITLTSFETEDATCAGNDGRIFNITPSGGSGSGYQFAINEGSFSNDNFFDDVSGGTHKVTVRDGAGCEADFDIDVTFPGFVDYDVAATDATCDNNGLSGELEVTFAQLGTYEVGISLDPFAEPENYITYVTSPTAPLKFENLAFGTYYVFAKSTVSQCPTRQGPFQIQGVTAVTVQTQSVCEEGNKVDLVLQVTGDPNFFTIFVTNPTTGELVVTPPPVMAAQPNSNLITLKYDNFAFLRTPGDYNIQLQQVSDLGACLVNSEKVLYVVSEPLAFPSVATKESYPDMYTGEMNFTDFRGGLEPYQISVELELPAISGQSYSADFEEVMKNSNLRYQKVYENVPAGRYRVEVMDGHGCRIDSSAYVPLDTDIFIPNIFTPNDDGANDVFFIRNLPEGSKLIITNRWGNEVYSSNAYQNNWDGGSLEDGIYFYRLKPAEGEAINGWIEVLRGSKP
jgi:gliding motility-associated-like protein